MSPFFQIWSGSLPAREIRLCPVSEVRSVWVCRQTPLSGRVFCPLAMCAACSSDSAPILHFIGGRSDRHTCLRISGAAERRGLDHGEATERHIVVIFSTRECVLQRTRYGELHHFLKAYDSYKPASAFIRQHPFKPSTWTATHDIFSEEMIEWKCRQLELWRFVPVVPCRSILGDFGQGGRRDLSISKKLVTRFQIFCDDRQRLRTNGFDHSIILSRLRRSSGPSVLEI